MAISKSFADAVGEAAVAAAITSNAFDSTGFTHLVAFVKNESGATTVTMSDNKGSGSWNALTQVDHTDGGLASQMFWVKIGTPGSGHTVTASFLASRDWPMLAVWLVNADSGEIELDAEAFDQGVGTSVDAGSLATTGVSVVSFMGGGETDGVDWTPSSGWTEDVDNPGDAASFGASRGPETTTPIDPVATASSSMDWAAVAASFREAAGGGATIVNRENLRRGVARGVLRGV